MRLPVTPQLSTKDGVSNKNAGMTNVLKKTKSGGDLACVRSGLVTAATSTGNAGGLVCFGGELVSVYGTTLGFGVTPTESVAPLDMDSLDPSDLYPFQFLTLTRNGDIAAGYKQWTVSGTPKFRATIWESGVGFTNMGSNSTADLNSSITGIADTGRVCGVYYAVDVGLPAACYWDAADAPVTLPTRGGDYTYAYAISFDGTIIVGYSVIPEYYDENLDQTIPSDIQGMLWTIGVGYTLLGANTSAYGISEDKATLYGVTGLDAVYQAATWTSGGGWVNLTGAYPNGSFIDSANSDLSVLVGWVKPAAVVIAFKWTSGTGIVLLDSVSSVATGVSDDGTVVVGYRLDPIESVFAATMWIDDGDAVQVNENFPTVATYCHAISSDGTIVLGSRDVSVFVGQPWLETVSTASSGTIPALATIAQGHYDFAQSPL